MFGKKKSLAMYSGLLANEWILQDGELAEQLTPAELPCSPVNSPFFRVFIGMKWKPSKSACRLFISFNLLWNVTVTFVLQILLSPRHAIFLKVFFRQPSQAIQRFHKKFGQKCSKCENGLKFQKMLKQSRLSRGSKISKKWNLSKMPKML